MKFKLTYPERIGSRRRELGMTRYDLARISRVAYSKLTDLERNKYKRVDALVFEAVAFALRIHPLELSAEYEPPEMPTIRHVAVDGR
jgi:transcriptional regulator with XRE-family HTH domain